MKNHELIDFKVGDLVVYKKSHNGEIYKIKEVYLDPRFFVSSGSGFNFLTMFVAEVRHATASEIAANKREDLR